MDIFLHGLTILVDPADGSKAQGTTSGRLLKLGTSFCVIVVLTVYTGQTAAALTTVSLDIEISKPSDLLGRTVAFGLPNTQAYKYTGYYYPEVNKVSFPTFEQMVFALDNDEVEAVVFEMPTLVSFANNPASGCKYMVTGEPFASNEYGLVLPKNSALTSTLSQAIVNRLSNDLDGALIQKYFSSNCPADSTENEQIDVVDYYGLLLIFAAAIVVCTAISLLENSLFSKF
jgi:hypothetical protein